MALIHWWPLDGTLDDYGSNPLNLTSYGTVTAASGKIGSCYDFGNSGLNYLATTSTEMCPSNISYTAWICPNSSQGRTTNDGIVSNHNHPSFKNISLLTVNKNRIVVEAGFTDNTRGACLTYNMSFIADTWYHVAMTYKNSTKELKLYVNGNNVSTVILTKQIAFDSYYYVVGLWAYSYRRQYSFNGKLNDVRVYDSALSPKEIEEIARGLVLHYNFDESFVEPTTNLFGTKSIDFSGWSSYGFGSLGKKTIVTDVQPAISGQVCKVSNTTSETNAATEMATWTYSDATLTTGGKATFSIYVKGTGATIGRTGQLHVYNSSGTHTQSDGVKSFTFSAEWQRVSGTFTWRQTENSSTNFSCYVYASMKSGESFYISNAQFEFKDHSTQFTSGTRSTGIIYDSSGNRINGDVNGNVTFDSTTTGGAVVFPGNVNSFINCGNKAFITDQISVCWWGYMDNWANYGRALSCTQSGGWCFEPSGGNMWFSIYAGGYSSANGSTQLSSYSSGWHYFVGTFDGMKAKIYIDGILDGTSDTNSSYPSKSSKTAIGYANNSLFIGAEAAGNTSTPTTPTFNGKISDARIYATALTDAQVKELYDTKFIITNSGATIANKFSETKESFEFDNNSIASEKLIIEPCEMDGSLWLPICYQNVKKGTNMFSASDSNLFRTNFVYHNNECWAAFHLIDALQPSNDADKYTFMVLQQNGNNGQFAKYAWKQNISPMTATRAQVTAANITKLTSNIAASYGGMYVMNGSVWMCLNNGSASDWFGCAHKSLWGGTAGTDGYTPGYNNERVYDIQIVYMKINKNEFSIHKDGIIQSTNIIERY